MGYEVNEDKLDLQEFLWPKTHDQANQRHPECNRIVRIPTKNTPQSAEFTHTFGHHEAFGPFKIQSISLKPPEQGYHQQHNTRQGNYLSNFFHIQASFLFIESHIEVVSITPKGDWEFMHAEIASFYLETP